MNKNPRFILEDKRFGKLIVLEYIGKKKFLCICDCGNKKIVLSDSLRRNHTQSCGCLRSIFRENYDEDVKKKLLSSIKINENGCWEWQKAKHRQGYGHCPYKRKCLLAHRVSWMVFKGNLPDDILVCHHCDNPPCINPDHLFLGTDKDNTLDHIKKGKSKKSRGENHYFSKLTEKEVKEMRKMRERKIKIKDISRKFNIHVSTAKNICLRKSWKHVI